MFYEGYSKNHQGGISDFKKGREPVEISFLPGLGEFVQPYFYLNTYMKAVSPEVRNDPNANFFLTPLNKFKENGIGFKKC